MGQLDVFTLSILFAFVKVANARQVHTPTPNVPSQMTHLHSLTAIALALLLASSCCAELVNSRPPPPHKCTVSGPTKQPDPLADNSELLDIVLLASVDGKFHALNRTTGHTVWSMSSFSSSSTTVSPPSSLAPLVCTCHIDQDPDLTDNLDAYQETYVIEPQSGDIYILPSCSAPLQRFPYSMPELVDMSPFSFAMADDHRVFVGRKATAEVVVELKMGEVRFGGPDTCPWGPFPDLDARDGSGRRPLLKRREVVLGRTGMCVPGDTLFRKLNYCMQTTTLPSIHGRPTNTS
jgi:serine/threonine-protein kinase/endoribonuclease IRE1